MYEVMVESNFSAAHQLRDYNGKCENIHGHNWKVQVWIRGKSLQPNGILIDFYELKEILDLAVKQLDHSNLNELEIFKTRNPTAENVACHLYGALRADIQRKGLMLFKVDVWESEKTMSGYFE